MPTNGYEVLSEDVTVPQQSYQEIIGCLMWIAGSTRPDICYGVRYLARYASKPYDLHLRLAQRLLAYLQQSKDYGLTLGGSTSALEGWVDADYAGCTDTRCSTTGYIFKFCDSAISWQSKRQATVAQSTLEAEYVAAAEAAREAMWLRTILEELGFQQGTTRLNCDNMGAILLANKPGTHARSKHIDVRHHYLRQKIDSCELNIVYVRSAEQDADFLTKPLAYDRHAANFKRVRLGVLRGPMRSVVEIGTVSQFIICDTMPKAATPKTSKPRIDLHDAISKLTEIINHDAIPAAMASTPASVESESDVPSWHGISD